MTLRICGIALVFLACVVCVCCGGSPATTNSVSGGSNEILYVASGSAITTYSVDPLTFALQPLGQPVQIAALNSLVQLVASPNGRFLYLLWRASSGGGHLSVYATDSLGIPKIPAVQELTEPDLFQLNSHPSGKFAYTLEVKSSNGQFGPSSSAEYTASIRLFHVDSATGFVKEDSGALGTYGPSFYWPLSLYGVSSDGSNLILNYNGASGSAYRERRINPNSGALSHEVGLFGQTGAWQSDNNVTIGTGILIDKYNQGEAGFLDVFANPPKNPSEPLIHCTATMFVLCHTVLNAPVGLFEKYLFFTDPLTFEVRVAEIDLGSRKIRDTGQNLPPIETAFSYFFSPDNKIIYATLASDMSLHAYGFDGKSGTITDGQQSIPVPSGNFALCPATRR